VCVCAKAPADHLQELQLAHPREGLFTTAKSSFLNYRLNFCMAKNQKPKLIKIPSFMCSFSLFKSRCVLFSGGKTERNKNIYNIY
jgi:hypothetical protein